MVRILIKKQYKRRTKCQRGGFLNQYHFANVGRGAVNQVMKGLDALAPKLIKQATGQIDQIAQRHIQEIINQGGQQVEKIAAKILKGAIEQVCKTPFGLLGRFGKKTAASICRIIKKIFRR